QVAADLFHDDAAFDVAEPRPAQTLRQQQAAKPHLGERLPQRAREPVGIARVAQFAQMRDRRLVGKEGARIVAHHHLLFGEDERHRRSATYAPGSSRMRLAMTLSWTSLVPPSIEFALVRSQPRAASPPRERSLSHSRASEPPAVISSS